MNILITGGTGSLGKALIAKLIDLPSFERICIYSRDEHKQDQVRKLFNNSPKLRFFIGDIRDKDRLSLAVRSDIQVIIHAAAMKIVPTAEYNPFEAIKTNILGAQNLVDCCIQCGGTAGYPKVLAISTDKSVNPINLYGATKLCAEKLFISANNIMGYSGPRFSVCRYGNVANSNGSVIPLFKEQLAKNEQLTITHDQMTRFWITLEEAVQLIFNSLDVMVGGEIFIPKMRTFNVKQLAMLMMQQANYDMEHTWTRVIGIRPGEKLHEIIMTREELKKSDYNEQRKMFIIRDNKASYDPITPDTLDITSITPDTLDITSNLEGLVMSDEELSNKLRENTK